MFSEFAVGKKENIMPSSLRLPALALVAGVLVPWGIPSGPPRAAGDERRTVTSSIPDGQDSKSSRSSSESSLDSGRAIGEYVPTFYTRVVTGPLMNRSVCYVCRNGRRPVVMVFLRKLGPDLKPLLKQVDSLVDEHRAEGLRSFGVHVSDSPASAISDVQTFSFDHKIRLPLTVGSSAIAEPHCQNLNAQADVTVVLYQDRRVVSRFAFRAGEIQSPEIEQVTQSIQKLLKPESEAGDRKSGG